MRMITITLNNDFFGTFVCPNDAKEFKTFEHGLVRSEKWKSVFESFGLSVSFFGPACDFLIKCYNKFGQDVKVAITVTESDYLGNQLVFQGLLNFAENAVFSDLTDSVQTTAAYRSKFITLQVVPAPADLKTLLESRSRVKITMPISYDDVFENVEIGVNRKWSDKTLNPTTLDNSPLTDLRLYRPQKVYIHSKLGFRSNIWGYEQLPYFESQGVSNITENNWFFQNSTNLVTNEYAEAEATTVNDNANLTGTQVNFRAQVSGSYRFKIKWSGKIRWKNQGITINSVVMLRLGINNDKKLIWKSPINSTLAGWRSENVIINYNKSLILEQNDEVRLVWELSVGTAWVNNIVEWTAQDFRFEIQAFDLVKANYQNLYMAHEFAAGLLNILIGRECLQSTILGRQDSYPTAYPQNGNAGFLSIGNGSLLREASILDAEPVQTSFDEFFTALNTCYNVGLWIDYDADKIIIEHARDFYNPNLLAATFNFVPNIKVTVAGDRIYNQVGCSYANYDSESADEIHAESQFTSPLMFTSNEFKLQSSYISSGELINRARKIGERAGSSRNGEYTRDNFFVCTVKSNRIRVPILGVNSAGNILYLPPTVWWGYENLVRRERTTDLLLPIIGLDATQFEVKNAGVNNGIYNIPIPEGITTRVFLPAALPAPSQVIPGQSYIEIILREDSLEYSAQTTQNYTLVENYDLPEAAFNIDLTPTRCLLRHKFYWNTGLQKTPDRLWRFGAGKGNVNFTSKKDAGAFNSDEYLQNPLKENGDILPFDELLAAVYSPEIIEFEAPVTVLQWKELQQKRHGYVQVSDQDSNYLEGYILDAKRVRKGETVIGRFKLLRKFDSANQLPAIA